MNSKIHRNSRKNIGKNQAILLMAVFCLIIGMTSGLHITIAANTPPYQGILAQLNKQLTNLEDRMNKAQSEQVHLFSPNVFREAQENLDKAKEDLDKGKDVKGIQKKLDTAESQLTLAIKNAKEARKQLPDLIAAREDALAGDAPEYALELYDEAEKLFKEAMEEIEDNDINGAIRKGKAGEMKFRDAELNAIKSSIIGKVHTLLEKAQEAKADKYAPITLNKAHSLIQEAENILNTNRKAQATARQKAEEAEYEASHAIYISDLVQDYKEDDKNWEKLILSYEDNVRKVTTELNFKPRFDTGLEKPLNSIRLAVTNIKDDNKRLSQELTETNNELTKKRNEIKLISSKLDKTEAGLKEKAAQLEAEKRKEAKIKRVENLFGPSEATVIREGTNLKIRLVGLSFPSGKTEIGVQYFGLLTKIQQAIREFPDCQIIIEGHTDSRGHESTNLRLSTARANAVKTYLLANMGLPESRIRAIGYGKSKPIATNETEKGRRKNRRIDVVLEIGEASY